MEGCYMATKKVVDSEKDKKVLLKQIKELIKVTGIEDIPKNDLSMSVAELEKVIRFINMKVKG
jgi:hypothetical protein